MKQKKTKTSEILKYLQSHKKGLTPADAYRKFGSMRLADVVFNLRKQGHDIETRTERKKDQYGNFCEYARYLYR